jgi:hypothetical protein
VAEKIRGGRKAQPSLSPGRGTAEDAEARQEAGDFVAQYDVGKNRGGMVPAGGGPNEVDPRRRIFLGKHRLGKRWSEVIMAVNDGVFTWDEFVETLDDTEIARGQLKDKAGRFRGRPPTMVPRAFFDACQKVLVKRARSEYEKAYLEAIKAMTTIAKGEELGAKPADKIKAAQFIIERLEGKAPEKLEVKISNPFEDMISGAIAEVSEDAAIANAQEYLSRKEATEETA